MRKLLTSFSTLLIFCFNTFSQQTFPVNGVRDDRNITYAFINATIVQDYKTIIEGGKLVIRSGKIIAVGKEIQLPADAVIQDVKGKYIYPALIDIYADYGIASKTTVQTGNRGPQFLSNTAGAYNWNQAIRPETEADKLFVADAKQADDWRKLGFGMVMSIQKDGIARGTGVVVMLNDDNENDVIVKEKGAALYSFDKGSSTQDYPASIMGSIALLRQTFYDADWYSKSTDHEYNISLEALNKQRQLPQIIDAGNYLNDLRADKVGKEFNIKFIIKGGGDEYKDIQSIKAAGNSYIIPLKYPDASNVSDPYEALNISLEELKHWELAPANSVILEKEAIPFAFTTDGLQDKKELFKNIQKSISLGLTKEQALRSLTSLPAEMLHLENKTGSIKPGMIANFLITSKELFDKDNILFENWVAGKQYIIRRSDMPDLRGRYKMLIDGQNFILRVSGERYSNEWNLEKDTLKSKVDVSLNRNLITLVFDWKGKDDKGYFRLDGVIDPNNLSIKGAGLLPNGKTVSWQAVYDSVFKATVKVDTAIKELPTINNVWFPNAAYGFEELPKAKPVLIRNATVWTNEKDGILKNADVLINNGKIEKVGKNLTSSLAGLEVIDGTNKHVTAGIIDEHSHIAISGDVNEGTEANSSEVRIGDVLDCNDVNIYRQLAGGVTSSHLLHGSANPIGGQTQLIKLRWGKSAEDLKFKPWDGFIKFALGENVKQSNWGDNQSIRYPQTRMGVEQVYIDAFTRARAYEKKWNTFNTSKDKTKAVMPRRDLKMDAMSEILNKKRFITCHSYVQSEINMLMHVADSFNFRINTFTHILEGYKVADKMKQHGVGASTFSDWWAYKYEVMEAIPYNMYILNKMGIVTAVNSDDGEMARRLNQEAAKSIMYGGLTEEDAWKICTLNPAKLLHVDDRVGSIKEGKDADIVLWNDNPLSVYAHPLKTFVDGICYFDVVQDSLQVIKNNTERQRLIQKMLKEKNNPGGSPPPVVQKKEMHCKDEEK